MRRALALLLVLCLFVLTGCSGKELTRYTHSFFGTFDTFIVLNGYADSQETFDKAAKLCESEFRRYHELFTAYNHSETVENIFNLNEKAWQAPVQVSAEMMELLSFCKSQAEISPVVNPAMGRVLRLWHNARSDADFDPYNAAIPAMEALEEANEHTDLDDLILDEENMTVFFADEKLRLDLGAIAKGYAAEKVAEKVADIIPVFSLNAGGNIVAGKSVDGKGWKVGVQHPDKALISDDNTYLCTLQAENCAIVTSGDYQRYFWADGQRWHHLIDPETLLPANRCRAVTIIAPTSTLADWLSTAAFVLPYEQARALVEQSGAQALWYLPDGAVEMTEGFEKLLTSDIMGT